MINLTKKEKEVIKYLALPGRVAAGKLGISLPTYKCHLRHIFCKLLVESCSEAIVVVLRNGLIHLDDFILE